MDNKYVDIAQDPSYWVEHINTNMYDAMISYMELKGLNKTQFAAYLGISKGRLSQILNSGEINFSIEKLFTIALKIDKIPRIAFQDKEVFLANTLKTYKTKIFAAYQQNSAKLNTYQTNDSDNIIQFPKEGKVNFKYS